MKGLSQNNGKEFAYNRTGFNIVRFEPRARGEKTKGRARTVQSRM